MGPDGNIWGQVNDNLGQPAYGLRIWLGASNTGAVTEYAGIVSNNGMASGAGALWFYDQSTGNALRVVP